MMPDVLQGLLEQHQRWYLKKGGGRRLDLAMAELHGCGLTGALLAGAKLSGANLGRAIGTAANLIEGRGSTARSSS
jgi:uncharacterized protein YjbI with pentapeptide repeats